MNALTPTTRAAALFDLAGLRMEDVPPLKRAADLIREAVALVDAEAGNALLYYNARLLDRIARDLDIEALEF